MATLSSLPAGGIIESASLLFGSRPSNSARVTSLFRHQATPENDKQKRAMARRLEQLHAALGGSEVAPTAPSDITPLSAAGPAGNVVGIGSLFITGIISTLFGAGVMWLATQHEQAPATPAYALHAAAITPTARTAPKPASITPVAPAINDETRISDLLEAWRNAWTQRHIAAYLNVYSQQFSPADGSPHDAWVTARTKKLSTGAPIDIRINNLAIERIDADQFKATFLQDYVSGSYRETARAKTLLIARENGEWRIRQEQVE